MKKKVTAFLLVLLLSTGATPHLSAAEVWSDGDWQLGSPANQPAPPPNQEAPSGNTTLWSENLWQSPTPGTAPTPGNTTPSPQPGTTLWSESLWQDPPTSTNPNANPNPPSPNQPPTTPLLPPKEPTLITLTAAPFLENGKILVPARDILEPLGAQLQFDPIKQLLTIRKGKTVANVILNNDMVMVNGSMVKLEAPVRTSNGQTFIPLSFLVQVFGSKVTWEASTTKVTVDDWLSFYLDTNKMATKNLFIGNWSIWIPGGYATTGTSVNGDGSKTVTQQYIPGAKGYTLSILANGTYSWQTTGGTINGAWKTEADGRIVLIKGKHEFDWYVTAINENEIKFYSYGLEEHGTRIKP